MTKYIVLSAFLALSVSCNNSKVNQNTNGIDPALVNNPRTANGMDTVAAARKPTMEFADTSHDFGTIIQDEIVSYDFAFTNNGKTPLIISGAAGSCGCTVPVYPHDPIPPGGKGTMKVTFNSASKEGPQNKTVTINTNTLRGIHMLYIHAEVKVPKDKK